jgi:murein DD-endopeptidase MepM/ murein hydrolase activator NlpD
MAGGAGHSTEPISARLYRRPRGTFCCLIVICSLGGHAFAETLYSYRDEMGTRVFADRPPENGQDFKERVRADTEALEPKLTIVREDFDTSASLSAVNDCYCPAEVILQLTDVVNASTAEKASAVRLVPARDTMELMTVKRDSATAPWSFDVKFAYVFGDPEAQHGAGYAYRPPFAAARRFLVSQAYPDSATHDTAQSRYAVDIAMPERSGVFAARSGVVVSVTHSNFRGGTNIGAFGSAANVVKIMHDDGTFALYAHLSWDSIRVRPGQQVSRGEYIAASGNTGFSTGPHLHFAVIRNDGLKSISVPVQFQVGQGDVVSPQTGAYLSNP